MEQFQKLLAYQKEDLKVDKLEAELNRNPVCQKIDSCRASYTAKQKQYRVMEEQVSVLTDRMDMLREAIAHSEDQLRALQTRFDNEPPTDLDATRAFMSEVSKVRESISSYESEMKRMAREAVNFETNERKVRREAFQLREEYNSLKKQRDEGVPEKTAALAAQQAVRDQLAEGIPAPLLKRYKEIKRRISPPLSRLVGDQCSGCNMSLPSAVLRQVRAANDDIVECESCGRLIIP